jgi:hypothetical protein
MNIYYMFFTFFGQSPVTEQSKVELLCSASYLPNIVEKYVFSFIKYLHIYTTMQQYKIMSYTLCKTILQE